MTVEDRRLHITSDRIIDQFNTLVPQQHLTLVSVLQGVALVALISAFRPPTGFGLHAILVALIAHHGYLPHIASLLYIVVIWNEYMYAVIIGHWPLRSRWTLLQFLVTLSEVAAFSTVDSVGAWIFWMGITGLLGYAIRKSNIAWSSPTLFEDLKDGAGEHVYLHRELIQRRERGVWSLALVGIPFIVGGFLRELHYSYLTQTVSLPTGQHVTPFDVVAPSIAIVYAVVSMRHDDSSFSKSTERILSLYHSTYQMGMRDRKRRDRKETQDQAGVEPMVLGVISMRGPSDGHVQGPPESRIADTQDTAAEEIKEAHDLD